MSGKKAKLERKAIRAAGHEDKVTRKLRLIKERMEAEERAQKARAEARANETPEQRAARESADRAAMHRVVTMMGSVLAMVGTLPPVLASTRDSRSPYQRRGR